MLTVLVLLQHPGGQEAHLRVAGKDASKCFDEVGHSDEAEMLMKKFRIGVVREGEVRIFQVQGSIFRIRPSCRLSLHLLLFVRCECSRSLKMSSSWRRRLLSNHLLAACQHSFI